MKRKGLALAVATMVAGVAAVPAMGQDKDEASLIARMLAGESATEGAELEAIEEAASAYPLGSKENPVRVSMPAGQRAYLASLRCENLKVPEYERAGSAGFSPYGNIMDVYRVTCPGSEPAAREIYLDMYHSGHVETRAVEGYGIAGGSAD